MEELSSLSGISWAASAAVIAVIAFLALKRKWKLHDEEYEIRKNRYNEYISTMHDWQDCIDNGDKVGAAECRNRLSRMEKEGWNKRP